MHQKKRSVKFNSSFKDVLLTLICVSAIIFSVYKIYSIKTGYSEAEYAYRQLSSQYTSSDESSPLSVDYSGLSALCQDYRAWIYINDTVINYPVVYNGDNSYYLHHFINGDESDNGTLFIDADCAPDFSGQSTIIYGHNMKDGSMFASLCKYREQKYYEKHSDIFIITDKSTLELKPVAAFVTEADSSVYKTSFPTKKDYDTYITEIVTMSDIDTGIIPQYGDRLVVLSTCSYEYENARYVLICVIGDGSQ